MCDCVSTYIRDRQKVGGVHFLINALLKLLDTDTEEVGTDHVSDHALRFSSDVSMELMYRLSFCRNCESLHPEVGLNGKSS